MEEPYDLDQPEPEEAQPGEAQPEEAQPEGAGVPWGAIVAVVGTIFVVVFAVQNTSSAPINFLWFSGEFPVAIVILVTAVVSGLLAITGWSIYRRRRLARRAEKRELRRFRGEG